MVLPARLTLAIPISFLFIINFLDRLHTQLQATLSSLFWETFAWLHIILAQIAKWIMIVGHEITYDLLIGPTYFWRLLHDPKGRSILDILRDPCPHSTDAQSTNSNDSQHTLKQRIASVATISPDDSVFEHLNWTANMALILVKFEDMTGDSVCSRTIKWTELTLLQLTAAVPAQMLH